MFSRQILPIVSQRQGDHMIQTSEWLWTDLADLVPSYEQVSGVPRDPCGDRPQVFGDALDGLRRLRTLAARRARCVNGAEERAQSQAARQSQHGAEGKARSSRHWQTGFSIGTEKGGEMKRSAPPSRFHGAVLLQLVVRLQLSICPESSALISIRIEVGGARTDHWEGLILCVLPPPTMQLNRLRRGAKICGEGLPSCCLSGSGSTHLRRREEEGRAGGANTPSAPQPGCKTSQLKISAVK